MSVTLTINGTPYTYPEQGDQNWGPDATDWAIAVTSGMLQKAGGLFQLLAEVDFGPTYGIKSAYFKSRTVNTSPSGAAASVGVVRLARTDGIYWRNNLGTGDLGLAINAFDQLTFNGTGIGKPSLASIIVWRNDGPDAPIDTTQFGNEVFLFADGEAQNSYCCVKVPVGYTPGTQLFMAVSHYHSAASGTQLMQAQATLVKPGEAFSSTTNQHTSNNTAQTAGVNELINATMDLTDASGLVNGVAVAAGDCVKVRMYRGSDSSTADISVVPSLTEVRF